MDGVQTWCLFCSIHNPTPSKRFIQDTHLFPRLGPRDGVDNHVERGVGRRPGPARRLPRAMRDAPNAAAEATCCCARPQTRWCHGRRWCRRLVLVQERAGAACRRGGGGGGGACCCRCGRRCPLRAAVFQHPPEASASRPRSHRWACHAPRGYGLWVECGGERSSKAHVNVLEFPRMSKHARDDLCLLALTRSKSDRQRSTAALPETIESFSSDRIQRHPVHYGFCGPV